MNVGSKVRYHGKVYEIIRKHTGIDLYSIAKVLKRYADGTPKVVLNQMDGVSSHDFTEVAK